MSLMPASRYEIGDILVERDVVYVSGSDYNKAGFRTGERSYIIITGKRFFHQYLEGYFSYDYYVVTSDRESFAGQTRVDLSQERIDMWYEMHEFAS